MTILVGVFFYYLRNKNEKKRKEEEAKKDALTAVGLVRSVAAVGVAIALSPDVDARSVRAAELATTALCRSGGGVETAAPKHGAQREREREKRKWRKRKNEKKR